METIFDKALDKFKKVSESLDGSNNYNEKHRYSRKIIGVYGCSGGIGVSSLITELAVKFASYDNSVIIIDGNFICPHQRIYYNDNKKSFTDKIQVDEPMDDIICKSRLNSNIDYCSQSPIGLQALIRLDEVNDIYKKTLGVISKLRLIYDIILIDLCPYLLTTLPEQALLKVCEQFIRVSGEPINNTLNSQNIVELLDLTSNPEAPTLELNNKAHIENGIYLPFEETFEEIYNNAKSFLLSGTSNSDLYIKQFEIFMEFLIRDINEG